MSLQLDELHTWHGPLRGSVSSSLRNMLIRERFDLDRRGRSLLADEPSEPAELSRVLSWPYTPKLSPRTNGGGLTGCVTGTVLA